MGHQQILRDLVRSLGWTYVAVWSPSCASSDLTWSDGWCQSKSSVSNTTHTKIEKLYQSAFKSCSFPPGAGYVGCVLASGQHMWLNGQAVIRNSHNTSQAYFFKASSIKTVLCIPWFNAVVELGTTALVTENQKLLDQIQNCVTHLPFLPKQLRCEESQESISSDVQLLLGDQRATIYSPPHLGVEESPAFSVDDRKLLRQFLGTPKAIDDVNVSAQVENDGAEWEMKRNNTDAQSLNVTRSPTSILQQSVSTPMSALREEYEQPSSTFISSDLKTVYHGAVDDFMVSSSGDQSTSSVSYECNQARTNRSFRPWKVCTRNGTFKKSKGHVLFRKCMQMMRQIPELQVRNDEERKSKGQTDKRTLLDNKAISSHDEAAFNHMLAERKRRERQKENFNSLRVLIPFVTKVDRASILGDAIKYVKQLQARVQELEQANRELQASLSKRQGKV